MPTITVKNSPPDIYELLKQSAAANRRSINSEIITHIERGVFGVECANCHTTTAWAPARLVRHSFPLDHGEQGEIACETCHVRIYVEYTCTGCHEHDPAKMQRKHAEKDITGARLEACVECHPTGREAEED